MTVFSANRTALFIDGANLHSTAKTLGLIYFMGERRYRTHRACATGVRRRARLSYGSADIP
jgi:hypothetical protein